MLKTFSTDVATIIFVAVVIAVVIVVVIVAVVDDGSRRIRLRANRFVFERGPSHRRIAFEVPRWLSVRFCLRCRVQRSRRYRFDL
jgi:preprotein translocase subunit SecY